MDIDPKLLRYLLAIDRRGSFVRAAELLNISQPALSVAISRLEDVVGARLMERGRHGAQLNPLGRLLARHASSVETVLETARHELSLFQREVEGPLAIGGTPLVAASIIPDVLAQLEREVDKLSVRVVEGLDEDLFEQLERYELDVVISNIGLVPHPASARCVPLFDARTMAVVRPGHALAGRDLVTLSELLDWTWAFPPRGGAFRLQMEAIFATYGLPFPGNLIEAAQFSILKKIVQKSDAVTLLSDQIVREELEEGTLVTVPLAEKVGVRRFGLYTLSSRKPNRLVSRFIEIALAVAPGYEITPRADPPPETAVAP